MELTIHHVVPRFQIKKERKAFPKSLILFLFLLSSEIRCSDRNSGISPKKIKKEKPLTGQESFNKIPESRLRSNGFFEKNIYFISADFFLKIANLNLP